MADKYKRLSTTLGGQSAVSARTKFRSIRWPQRQLWNAIPRTEPMMNIAQLGQCLPHVEPPVYTIIFKTELNAVAKTHAESAVTSNQALLSPKRKKKKQEKKQTNTLTIYNTAAAPVIQPASTHHHKRFDRVGPSYKGDESVRRT